MALRYLLTYIRWLIEVEIDVNVDVEWAVGHPSSSISLKISRYGLQEPPQSNTAGEN